MAISPHYLVIFNYIAFFLFFKKPLYNDFCHYSVVKSFLILFIRYLLQITCKKNVYTNKIIGKTWKQLEKEKQEAELTEPFIVPLAIPLVAGPAVLAAVMLYSPQVPNLIMIGAISLSWFVTFYYLLT